MDKLAKVREWIQTRKLCTMDEHMNFYCKEAESDYNMLSRIEEVIDSLQEESVSEELEEAIEQSFIYHENRGDDFRSDEQIETTYRNGFESGAKWKKEQMMSKAKGGTVQKDYQIIMDDGTYIDLDPSMQLKPAFNINVNDKVKVIVTKED